VSDISCSECGHTNQLGSNFCSSCGHPLEERRADSTTIMFEPGREDGGIDLSEIDRGDLPPGTPLLVILRGPSLGSRIALVENIVTAGRHPDSDIFLDDITVSRRHAELVRHGEGFRVRDAGSLNGTYLNRERIDKESVLAHGDELQVGKFKLVYLEGEG